MAGSIRNNNSAEGTIALSLSGAWTFGGHLQIGSNAGPQWQYLVELNDGSTYRGQFYIDNGSNNLRFYSDEVGEVTVATGGAVNWGYGRISKPTATSLLVEYLPNGSSTWTTVASVAIASATTTSFYAFRSRDNGFRIADGRGRSWGLWSSALSQAQSKAEAESRTPVLSAYAYWLGGDTPAAATWGNDTSGNARHLTVSGTAVANADDPVAASGGTTTLTLTGDTANTIASTLALRATLALSGATGSTSPGVLTTRHVLGLAGDAASAVAATLALRATLALSGDTASSAPGSLATRVAYALAGDSGATVAGALALRLTLTLTGDAAATTPGDLGLSTSSAVALTLTGDTASAVAGAVALATRLALTGDVASTTSGSLATRRAYALAGDSAAVVAGGVAVTTLTVLRLDGDSASLVSGALSVPRVTSLAIIGASLSTAAGGFFKHDTLRLSGDVATLVGGSLNVDTGAITWSVAVILLHVSRLEVHVGSLSLDADTHASELSGYAESGFAGRVKTPTLELEFLQ